MRDTTSAPASLRKVAIVVATLDARSAQVLLGKMPEPIADQVRLLAADLPDISDSEREAVLQEFAQAGGLGDDGFSAGVELAPSLAARLQSVAPYDVSSPEPAPPADDPLFGFLSEVSIEAIVRHLERQYPQVTAVVIAHLPPARAAEIIKRFPSPLQADLLRRLARLDVTEPELLADIAAELQSLLEDDLRQARTRQTGLATISSILNAAGPARKHMLENLVRYDGELATHLTGASARESSSVSAAPRPRATAPPATRSAQYDRSAPPSAGPAMRATGPADVRETAPAIPPPTAAQGAGSGQPADDFDNLTQLSDDDWSVLMRAAEQRVLMLALAGASEELLQRITKPLSRREAQLLRDRLQQTGPVRLSDIEHAQQQVVDLTARLMADGRITRFPLRRGFAAAA